MEYDVRVVMLKLYSHVHHHVRRSTDPSSHAILSVAQVSPSRVARILREDWLDCTGLTCNGLLCRAYPSRIRLGGLTARCYWSCGSR
jgi:hypothetical protein